MDRPFTSLFCGFIHQLLERNGSAEGLPWAIAAWWRNLKIEGALCKLQRTAQNKALWKISKDSIPSWERQKPAQMRTVLVARTFKSRVIPLHSVDSERLLQDPYALWGGPAAYQTDCICLLRIFHIISSRSREEDIALSRWESPCSTKYKARNTLNVVNASEATSKFETSTFLKYCSKRGPSSTSLHAKRPALHQQHDLQTLQNRVILCAGATKQDFLLLWFLLCCFFARFVASITWYPDDWKGFPSVNVKICQ